MFRQLARRDKDDINADVIALLNIFMGDRLNRGDNTAEAIGIDGDIEIGLGCPSFDFDERHDFAALGDQVDLSSASFDALTDDSPTVESHPPRGSAFAPSATRLGGFPLQRPIISIALA
jgi:hypothetical protein